MKDDYFEQFCEEFQKKRIKVKKPKCASCPYGFVDCEVDGRPVWDCVHDGLCPVVEDNNV